MSASTRSASSPKVLADLIALDHRNPLVHIRLPNEHHLTRRLLDFPGFGGQQGDLTPATVESGYCSLLAERTQMPRVIRRSFRRGVIELARVGTKVKQLPRRSRCRTPRSTTGSSRTASIAAKPREPRRVSSSSCRAVPQAERDLDAIDRNAERDHAAAALQPKTVEHQRRQANVRQRPAPERPQVLTGPADELAADRDLRARTLGLDDVLADRLTRAHESAVLTPATSSITPTRSCARWTSSRRIAVSPASASRAATPATLTTLSSARDRPLPLPPGEFGMCQREPLTYEWFMQIPPGAKRSISSASTRVRRPLTDEAGGPTASGTATILCSDHRHPLRACRKAERTHRLRPPRAHPTGLARKLSDRGRGRRDDDRGYGDHRSPPQPGEARRQARGADAASAKAGARVAFAARRGTKRSHVRGRELRDAEPTSSARARPSVGRREGGRARPIVGSARIPPGSRRPQQGSRDCGFEARDTRAVRCLLRPNLNAL